MKISLFNADCLEYIKTIPDKSVNLILTDPPYNIAKYSTGNIPLPDRSAVNNDLGAWNFSTQNEMHNYFECPICMGKERLKEPKHPSQKPLKLLRHLITIASDEEDIIFDPFMGVGSTGVAAKELNRSFIGCEIDDIFFEAARKRIEEIK
jgi:DNA modification methylase